MNSFKSIRLETECTNRQNNLNIIRFCAAIMVIISHSYPLMLGNGYGDKLNSLSNGKLSFGSLAVSIFFFYGGFLIYQSLERTQNGKKFFFKRIVRIFPPLIFVTFMLTLFVGPAVSSLSIKNYFCSVDTWKYLLNSLLLLVHDLPGVFGENIYNSTVNGVLWTLPVEFLCYIICYVAYKLHMTNKRWMFLTVIAGLLLMAPCKYFIFTNSLLGATMRPVLFFYIGMAMYVYRDKILLSRLYFLLSFAVVILFMKIDFIDYDYIMLLFLPYVFIYLAYGTRLKLYNFGNRYEISYGIYLTAWPIQQIFSMYFSDTYGPLENILFTIPLAILVGFIICFVIEKPMNRIMRKHSLR